VAPDYLSLTHLSVRPGSVTEFTSKPTKLAQAIDANELVRLAAISQSVPWVVMESWPIGYHGDHLSLAHLSVRPESVTGGGTCRADGEGDESMACWLPC
jgi:hypothetical protein